MRNWHEEEESPARELARKHYKPDLGRSTRQPPPRPLVELFEDHIERLFRDGRSYAHLAGDNVFLHHDAIHAMCAGRGWRTTSLSPTEIIVFGGT